MRKFSLIFRYLASTAAFAGLILVSPHASLAANTSELPDHPGKVVLVDFWASWCVPCRRSFPWMNEMQARYADNGLVIVAVNLDTDDADADAFLREFPATFTIVRDADASLAHKFDVIAMPSSYLIGRDGSQVSRHLGFKINDQDEYELEIIEALQQ